jgi:hypothetical protein
MLVQTVLSWGCARVAGEFLAADPGCDGRWLEIADVIVGGCGAGCGPGGTGTTWLRATLARYPGCAVAAAGLTGACVTLGRGGTVSRSGICGHYSCSPLAGGALVHCWLTAGWPRAALRQARFTPAAVVAQPGHCRWHVGGQAAGSPLSLVMSLQPGASALSVSSWRRTGSASGAPSSS